MLCDEGEHFNKCIDDAEEPGGSPTINHEDDNDINESPPAEEHCTPSSSDIIPEDDHIVAIEPVTNTEAEYFSKSVSPPVRADTINQKKQYIFSSLTNLANKIWDPEIKDMSAPMVISASMNDIDKFDMHHDHTSLISGFKRKGANTLELDAYDKIKLASLSLDDTVENIAMSSAAAITELQKSVKKLEYELDVANGTIKHVYDESTSRIHQVSVKYEAKIAHIDKQFIECIKEKDIIKGSLDECMEARRRLQSNKENLIKSLSNQADENERLRSKLHMSTEDCVKLKKDLDLRTYEVVDLKKQRKKAQDDLSAATIKVQWANTKLKSEDDAHQLTRTKLSGMDAKIRETKEEADMIRANCQAMINKYQNSEEIQSNALGSKLEKLEMEHTNLEEKFKSLQHKFEEKCIELETENATLERLKDQLFEKESDYRKVLEESKNQECHKLKLADELEDLDERLNSYNELRTELKNAYHNNQVLDHTLIEMRERSLTLEECNKILSEKEKDNLAYFQKISSKNAELQLEVNSLKIEGEGLKKQQDSLTLERDSLDAKLRDLTQEHIDHLGKSSTLISKLQATTEELEICKEALENEVRDMKNDAMISKRKHHADSKDLVRQIEQFRKQFERQEESMRRSESFNSIEDKRNRSGASSEAEDSTSTSNEGDTMTFERARALLTERLCSLQHQLAKRHEKIEFCESHINTLTRDIQKKSHIIQSLLLRVETGERTVLVGEAYKSSAPLDSSGILWGNASNGMTLKLSMEINDKLQQVLEDTLFKNITLKENVKTLGNEIERLNRGPRPSPNRGPRPSPNPM